MNLTPYHAKYFAHELTKHCASDSVEKLAGVASLEADLDDLDQKIRDTRREARLAPNLPAKLEFQRGLRELETKHTDAWKAYDEAKRDVDRQKDALPDEIGRRLEQSVEHGPLFALRWVLV